MCVYIYIAYCLLCFIAASAVLLPCCPAALLFHFAALLPWTCSLLHVGPGGVCFGACVYFIMHDALGRSGDSSFVSIGFPIVFLHAFPYLFPFPFPLVAGHVISIPFSIVFCGEAFSIGD